jgi:hypothetical protein
LANDVSKKYLKFCFLIEIAEQIAIGYLVICEFAERGELCIRMEIINESVGIKHRHLGCSICFWPLICAAGKGCGFSRRVLNEETIKRK